jgi:predicted SAM-dependent methyltransferase
MSVKIVLGCYDGEPHPYHHKYLGNVKEWILSDAFPRFPNLEKIDARDIPYTDVEAIYASHILEHIKYSQVQNTLNHWYSVLKVGGWVHINVPDVKWGLDALMKINCGENTGSKYFDCREKVMVIFDGSMDSEFDTHKSWFTKSKLTKLLKKAGFTKLKVWTEYEAHDMGCILARAEK